MEALERKISRHAERIASYAASVAQSRPSPEDLDSAQEIREQAGEGRERTADPLAAVEGQTGCRRPGLEGRDMRPSAGLDAQVNAERAAL